MNRKDLSCIKLSGFCEAKINLGLASDLTVCSWLWILIMGFLLCTFMHSWSPCLSRFCFRFQISLKKQIYATLICHLSHHQGSKCPPDRSWLCDLQPPWSHWRSADHSGWTPQCCGSAWGLDREGEINAWWKWKEMMESYQRNRERSPLNLQLFLLFTSSQPTSSCKKNKPWCLFEIQPP